jgi:type 1 fimbria pilin
MKSTIYTSILALLFFSCTSKVTFDPVPPVVITPNSDLLISEISTAVFTDGGTFRNHYIELYNGTASKIDLVDYAIGYFACKDTSALVDFSFIPATSFALSNTIDTNKCFVIASKICDVSKVKSDTTWGTSSSSTANASNPLQLSGNSAIALLKKDASGSHNLGGSNYKIIDVFGSPLVRRVNSMGTNSVRNNIMWAIGDENSDTRNRTFFRKRTVKNPTTDWDISRGSNNFNSQWTMSGHKAWDYTNIGLPTP